MLADWDIQPRSAVVSAEPGEDPPAEKSHSDTRGEAARLLAAGIMACVWDREGRRSEHNPGTARPSASRSRSEQVQMESCILSLNIFIETVKLSYLNNTLAVVPEPAPIDAHTPGPSGAGDETGTAGLTDQFPISPSGNQII